MPHYTYSRGARRKKLFTRISSTFIKNKSGLASSIAKPDSMLHSKSTYFYRWNSSHKLSSKLSYVVPSVCGLALLVGGIITTNPILNYSSRAHATGIKDTGDTRESTGSDADTTPSISIAFPTTGLPEGYNNSAEQTTIVTPGVVAYRSNYFDVTVKNPSWYAVSVRAAKGYTSELKNADSTNPAAIISGVGENITPNNFKENTWGYALTKVDSTDTVIDDTSLAYSTLPNEDSIAIDLPGYITDTAINDHYKVSFATLFSGDMPSGHYTTKVYLSAVTNPGHVTTAFANVGTMQDLAKYSDSCKNAAESTTAQLADERDGKLYWVTKLKDGNCWMTQNLDFDIPTTLSSETSNVNDRALATNITRVETIKEWTGTYSTYNAYYDPGNFFYDGPANNPHGQGLNCTISSTDTGDMATLKRCSQFSQNSPDMHYHVGNYYSYSAATVKSGNSIAKETIAPYSICPKGWKLPIAGQPDEHQGYFRTMLSKYGIDTNLTNNDASIYGNPLHFVYGGFITQGSLQYAGNYGYYRSSKNYGDLNGYPLAYNLFFDDDVDTSGNLNSNSTSTRYVGMSVRCVFIPE